MDAQVALFVAFQADGVILSAPSRGDFARAGRGGKAGRGR